MYNLFKHIFLAFEVQTLFLLEEREKQIRKKGIDD